MEMATENFKKAGEIFQTAIEIEDRAKREEYLENACEGDEKLRAEVQALLSAHEKAGDFLEMPDNRPGASRSIEGPGTKIGRYELVELIGEGGMGMVYLARQQEPVKRKVALKIVKLGMDTEQVVARFEAERQALAVLDHPNIARVLDAGATETGRPYFVMEYVKGMSISSYCDENKLGIEQRLRLFEQVCEGIHHAHQKGIIHRDLKPSNILVSVHGDRAVPKIIDFGIAKAVAQPLTEKSFVTSQGQLLGTPEYMSPEQVDFAARDIDTRSDIYSLGVVLYELLAGAPPFEAERLREGGIDNIQRIIRKEEPRTPSARLTSLGDEARAVAERRRTQIITLTRRLHRELEWIPMKAMRKDRTRRYRSASELADDIQNYLNGAPLIAGPESTVYRARKFVRKHAGSVATAAFLFVVIVLSLVASILMGCRAEQARKKETAARMEVEQAKTQAEERSEKYRNLFYVHSVAMADSKYRQHNVRSARKLLKSCPEDLRNWEWYRLDHVTDETSVTFGPSSNGYCFLSLSPDGRRIASGSIRTNDINVWDVESRHKILTLKGHKLLAGAIFSPDGKQIISGSFDKTIKVWDASTGDEIMTLTGHEGKIHGVAASPDGKMIVSGSYDNTVRIWQAATGNEIRTLLGHEGGVSCVDFSPDGREIASGSFDKTLRIWDAATGEQLKMHSMDDQMVIAVDYSPDGRRIAVGCGDGMIKIIDSENGQETVITTGQGWDRSLITSVDFSPDGTLLASGSYDQTVRVWNAVTGEVVTTFVGHTSEVVNVAFSPDGRRIVSGEIVGGIRMWNVSSDRESTILAGHKGLVHQLAFTADGERLVSCSRDNTIKLWDVLGAKEIRTIAGHDGPVVKVALSPDGTRIVSGSIDKTLRIWDAETGQELKKLTGHDGPVYSVAFSPDGKSVVSAGSDTKIKIWDVATGRELRTLSGHPVLVCNALFTPDGSQIVSGAYDGTVRVWDSTTGDQLMKLLGHKESHVESLAISPDGKRIVSGSFVSAKLWDTDTGAELMTIPAAHGIFSLAFSPDGTTIAGGCGRREGDITLWRSGRCPAVGSSE